MAVEPTVLVETQCSFTLPSGERCWVSLAAHDMFPFGQDGIPYHPWIAPEKPRRRFLEVVWEKTHPDAVIPSYAHEGDAGFDLSCVEGLAIPSGGHARVPVGLRAELPPTYWIWITSRSSTWDRGLMVIDGKIDSGYRGEWFARVFNWTDRDVIVEPGDRLVQGVIMRVYTAAMLEGQVDVAGTTRGAGGFGSTGHRSVNNGNGSGHPDGGRP